MPKYALLDEFSRCDGVLVMPQDAAEHMRSSEPWRTLLEVTDADAEVLRHLPHAMRYAEGQWCHVADEVLLEQFDRNTGLNRVDAMRAKMAREARRSEIDLSAYPEHTDPAGPEPVKWQRRCAFAPVVMGDLEIREATTVQCADLVTAMHNSGLFSRDMEESVDIMHRDANAWVLAFTWKGEVIQYECLTLAGDTVKFGFTEHTMRERPYWFWRALEQPVLEQLAAHGVTRGVSTVRSDATAYLAELQRTYAATSLGTVGEDGKYTELEYQLARTVEQPATFLMPRSAGAAWQWRSGQVSVREFTDLAAARAVIVAAWKGASRTAEMLRMLDERVGLDAATMLIGESPATGPIIYVVRERSADASSMSGLMPWTKTPEEGLITNGVIAWHAAVGYAKATTYYVPKRLNHPLGRVMVARTGATVTGERSFKGTRWSEISIDVAAAIARPEKEWTV